MTKFHDAQTGIGGDLEELHGVLAWLADKRGSDFINVLTRWMERNSKSLSQCKDDDDRGRFRCQVECQALERVRSFPHKLQEALNRKASPAPQSGSVED